MQHRNDDILLYVAIGDAVAAATEYVRRSRYPDVIEAALRLDRYIQHPTHLDVKPGRYTDDAQFSIAVAEALLDGMPLTEALFANMFVRSFKRDPRAGYARGFYSVLKKVRDGSELQRTVGATNPGTSKPWRCSPKNGAAMRAVPLGVLRDPRTIMRVSDVQANVTHDTLEGRFGSRAVALMSHFALYSDTDFSVMYELLEEYLHHDMWTIGINLRQPRRRPVKQPASNTVHAVFHLLTTCSPLPPAPLSTPLSLVM